METESQKTLFFLKSPKHNLNSIEGFLRKRDFNVVSTSNYKEAVGQVIPMNPEYIFIAWDHPQDQVATLPKLLAQSCTSKIIPYINSSDKHQHRKLQASGFDLKLFPPLSGPGIQRLIAKFEQSLTAAEQMQALLRKQEKTSTTFSKDSDVIQVRSTFKKNEVDDTEKQNGDESNISFENDQTDQAMFHEKTRADQLREFQKGLMNLRTKTDPKKRPGLSDGMNKVAGSMGLSPDQLNADRLMSVDEKSGLIILERAAEQKTIEEGVKNELLSVGQLTENQKQKINHSYLETVKLELEEYLGNFEDVKASYSDANTMNILNPSKHYCLVIQSAHWVGYLIISSEIPFERQSLEFILSKWVYENFGLADNQAEDLVNTSPLFEISLKDVPYQEFSHKVSDLTTVFEHNNQKMLLSFYSIDPACVFLRLHEKHDMILLSLAELPFEQNLEFDVCLYMPENDKFITYSRKNSKIQKIHLDRLKEKNVVAVYSNYENEVALQKFRAEFQMNQKVSDFLNEQKRA